jgi:putative transcriptional regulator
MLSESTKAQTCQKLTEMRLVDWLEFLLQTLWAIIMANAFDSIALGLQEAIDLNDGKEVAEKTHRPPHVDIAEIRHGLGLTPMEFASKFCISVSSLRDWERGDRNTHGPALALLNVVAKEAQAVMRALG